MTDFNIIGFLPLIFLIYLVFIMSTKKGSMLSCSFRRILKKRYILLILVFIAIFLYIESKDDDDNTLYFLKTFMKSLAIFIIFIISTKSDGIYTFIFLGLSGLLYLEDKYLLNNDNFTLISKDYLEIIKKVIFSISILVLLLGCITYFVKKKKQYKSNFSLKTYLIGVEICQHI